MSTSNALILACSKGNISEVQEILAQGIDIHHTDDEGKSALHHCVDIGVPVECAGLILDFSHALLEKTDSAGFTVLQLACMTGNWHLAQLLIDHGADLNAVDEQGHTPLHWAVICCQFSCVDALIRNGAKLSLSDNHGACPLHYVTQLIMKPDTQEYAPSIMYRLLDNGAPVDCTDQEGRTPLFWAAGFGLLDCCDALIKAGASVNHCDNDGLTLLHCAVSKGQTEIVSYLLDNKKINVDSLDQNECTPLFYAVTFNHPDLVTLLLSRGSNPNHQDKHGFTSVHCAAVKGNINVLSALVEKGGSLWIKNNSMDTPLHEACESGNLDLVKLMVDIAKSENKLHLLNEANIHGYTCVHLASEVGAADVCELIIKNGGQVNVTAPIGDESSGGFAPLDMASNAACRDLLLKQGGKSGIVEDCSGYSSTSENNEGNEADKRFFAKNIPENSKLMTQNSRPNTKSASQKSAHTLPSNKNDEKKMIILSARQSLHSHHKHTDINPPASSSHSNKNEIFLKPTTFPSSSGNNISRRNGSSPKTVMDKTRAEKLEVKKNKVGRRTTGQTNNSHSRISKNDNNKINKKYRNPGLIKNSQQSSPSQLERHNRLPPLNSSPDSGFVAPKLTLAQTISQSVLEFEGLRIATRDIAKRRRKELFSDYSAINSFANDVKHGVITSHYTNLTTDRTIPKFAFEEGHRHETHEADSPWTDRSVKSNGIETSRCPTDESSVYYQLNEIKRGPSTDDRRRIFELQSPRNINGKDIKNSKSTRITSAEVSRHKRLRKAYAPLVPMDDLIALFE